MQYYSLYSFELILNFWLLIFLYRDAPEATGEEPEDADFDMPKMYEPVSNSIIRTRLSATSQQTQNHIIMLRSGL